MEQLARAEARKRNKVKARKEREAKEVTERKQKQKEVQEKQIARIAREISAKDKARRTHAVALPTVDDSSDSGEDGGVQLQRRRFGQHPVPEPSLEVVLPDDLEDSLRRLKPEGNLMQERWRNMLVNGKMEVRKKQWQPKQVKKDRTEKWSYKDWKLR